jgi:hypothetical protein
MRVYPRFRDVVAASLSPETSTRYSPITYWYPERLPVTTGVWLGPFLYLPVSRSVALRGRAKRAEA